MATPDNSDNIALLVKSVRFQYVLSVKILLEILTCLSLLRLFYLACTVLVARA